jgi:hypothetical protein
LTSKLPSIIVLGCFGCRVYPNTEIVK